MVDSLRPKELVFEWLKKAQCIGMMRDYICWLVIQFIPKLINAGKVNILPIFYFD